MGVSFQTRRARYAISGLRELWERRVHRVRRGHPALWGLQELRVHPELRQRREVFLRRRGMIRHRRGKWHRTSDSFDRAKPQQV
ncbi:hypothetical protein CE91St30_22450 [Raoultibacter timonensis]|uniref:Uncharacterized protein n=1 Tax=Raoultibacter timonensis TaxID=1907662 RepID=A0ABM7WKN5_9ACTN|nr:hypothetical protein CE91St30_22450 [Raoultibacter timonensis]BDF51515.1 hypothetical protein CE91St31_22450 [Raoultibacter timonensis]